MVPDKVMTVLAAISLVSTIVVGSGVLILAGAAMLMAGFEKLITVLGWKLDFIDFVVTKRRNKRR